jgi:hypothetical protein
MRAAAMGLAIVATAMAAPTRVHLQTTGLDLYCACDEQAARAALERLAYVRGLFETLTGGRPTGPPARISLPSNPTDNDLRKAALEYTRTLLKQSEMSPPLWAAEGLAEYLSTAQPGRAGEPPPGRVESLQKGEWLGWDLLFSIDAASPLRNEETRQGALYDQGWALVHIYIHSKDLRPQLVPLFAAPDAKPGLTFDELDARFRRWLYPGPPPPENLPVPPALAAAQVKSVPVTDFESALLDAIAAGRPQLTALSNRYPQRPEPHEELARRIGPKPEARTTFDKAWNLGGKDPEVLWYYSVLLRSAGDAAKSNQVLQRCLQSDPGNLDARLMLAVDESAAGHPDRAVILLKSAPPPPQRRAQEYYRALANAARAAGNRAEAERAAQQLQSLARTDSDRREAEDLLRMGRDVKVEPKETGVNLSIDGNVGAAAPAHAPSRMPETYGPKESGTPPPPQRPTLDGTLVQVECRESSALLFIDTPQGRRRFLIDNPNAVIVRGTGSTELACGTQSRRVRIEFEERENTDPVVRVVEFR